MLLRYKADPTRISDGDRVAGQNALHIACRRNTAGCIEKLLEHDRSLGHTRTAAGEPPFYFAALHEQFAAMEALYRTGAVDVDAGEKSGVTALHNAVLSGHEYGVKRCLEMGCSVDAQTNRGETPLYVVCSTGNVAVIDMLLAKGKLPDMLNVPDFEGRRPFHIAHAQGHLDAAAYLLSKGARATCVGKCTKCRLHCKQAQRRLDRQKAEREKALAHANAAVAREEERRLVEQESLEALSFADFCAELKRVEQTTAT
eukprot:3123976-Prymnesium_polylepis.1